MSQPADKSILELDLASSVTASDAFLPFSSAQQSKTFRLSLATLLGMVPSSSGSGSGSGATTLDTLSDVDHTTAASGAYLSLNGASFGVTQRVSVQNANATLTFPLSPAAVAGQVFVITIASNASYAAPSGWALLGSASSNSGAIAVYTKTAAGGETSIMVAGGNGGGCGFLEVWAGISSISGESSENGQANNASLSTNAPAGSVAVAAVTYGDGGGQQTPQSGWTGYFEAGASGINLQLFEIPVSTAATETYAFTGSNQYLSPIIYYVQSAGNKKYAFAAPSGVTSVAGRTGAVTLSTADLADVADSGLKAPTAGQVLAWNATDGKYEPTSLASGGSATSYQNAIDAPPASPSAYDDEFAGSSLSSKWSVVNSTPANSNRAATVNNGKAYFDSPYTTGDRLFGIVQNAPSGAFTITAKVSLVSGVNGYVGPVIILVCSTGVYYLCLNSQGGGYPYFYTGRLNGSSSSYSFVGDVGGSGHAESSSGAYLRVQYDGTNVTFSYSSDGFFGASTSAVIDARTLASVFGAASTITQIGVGMQPYGAQGITSCDWFRVMTP